MSDHETNSFTARAARTAASHTQRIMAISGYVMLITAAGLLALLAYQVFKGPEPIYVPHPDPEQNAFVWVIQNFGYAILILFGSFFLGGIGIRLLGAAGKGTPTIIPPQDYELLAPLIQNANKEAIDQYVVLSSLSGFTGTFQKIGFSGLPLATVTLTLIFSALSFLDPEFLELAKLTLGAFIGSFVQKGQDAPKLPSMGGK